MCVSTWCIRLEWWQYEFFHLLAYNSSQDNLWHYYQIIPLHFLDFYFCSLFVVTKKNFLDSLLSYHLFFVLFSPSPSNQPPSKHSLFCGGLHPAKIAPNIFPFVSLLRSGKGNDNIYMFHYILYHHDKEGKKRFAMCFSKKTRKYEKEMTTKKRDKKSRGSYISIKRSSRKFYKKMRHILPSFISSGQWLKSFLAAAFYIFISPLAFFFILFLYIFPFYDPFGFLAPTAIKTQGKRMKKVFFELFKTRRFYNFFLLRIKTFAQGLVFVCGKCDWKF